MGNNEIAGTTFIDHYASFDPGIQAALLRQLEAYQLDNFSTA